VKVNNISLKALFLAFQASDQKKTHKEIGDIAGVADVTIRHAYKLMYPHASKLFPEDFKYTTPIEQLPQI
jgi:transcription initiation factor TFIIB